MTQAWTRVILGVLGCGAALAQVSPIPGSPAPGAKFEVAAIKPVLNWPPAAEAPGRRAAGGGCPTVMQVREGRVDFQCTTLAMLIGYAYRMSPDRVTGPAWMVAAGSPRFHIEVTIPKGASQEQVPEMFQRLLADRFKLVVHQEPANLPVYALVVARGGPKVQKAVPQAGAASAAVDSDAPLSRDGYYGSVRSRSMPATAGGGPVTLLSNARMGTVRQTGDPFRVQRWDAPDISLEGLADLLDHVAPLGLPVVDMTSLSGRYRLHLEVSLGDLAGAHRRSAESGVSDVGAETEQTALSVFNRGLGKLGLRLERRKAPLQTVVVDRVEKAPTEN